MRFFGQGLIGNALSQMKKPTPNRGAAYIDSVLSANSKLDWVKRLYEKNTPTLMLPNQKEPSTHFMESSDGMIYPTVVRLPDGKLKYLNETDKDAAYNYAMKTKEFIKFPTDEEAQWFGENYKKGTNVLKPKEEAAIKSTELKKIRLKQMKKFK